MGYRSDVAYTPECAIALSEVVVSDKEQAFYFTATDVKWYDSYPDVMSHHALIDLAGDWAKQVFEGKLHCRIGYVFVRIGENVEDIEERFEGDYNYDWIQVERRINMDW
jgi:hypothetical protein